ncbi:hypothetical protein RCL1_004905 [Eukaryota sp. TZLM3-RCL]
MTSTIIEDLKRTLNLRESEVADHKQSIETLRAVISILQKDNDSLQNKLDQYEVKIATLSSSSKPSSDERELEFKTVSDSLESAQASIKEFQTLAESALSQLSQTSSLYNSSQLEIETLKQELSSLKAINQRDLSHQSSISIQTDFIENKSPEQLNTTDTCHLLTDDTSSHVTISSLRAEISRLSSELSSAKSQLSQKSAVSPQKITRNDFTDGHNSTAIMKGFEHRINTLEKENQLLKSKLTESNQSANQIASILSSSKTLEVANKLLIEEKQRLLIDLERYEEEHVDLLQQMNSLASKLDFSNKNCLSLSVKLKEAEQARNLFSERVVRLQHELQLANSRLAKLRQSVITSKPKPKSSTNVDEVKNSLITSRNECLLLDEQKVKLEEELVVCRGVIEENERKLLEKDTEIENLRRKIAENEVNISDLNTQITTLKEEIEANNQERILYEKAREYWNSERKSLEEHRKILEARVGSGGVGVVDLELHGKVENFKKENEILKRQLTQAEQKSKSYRHQLEKLQSKLINMGHSLSDSSYLELLNKNIPKIEVDFSQYLTPTSSRSNSSLQNVQSSPM